MPFVNKRGLITESDDNISKFIDFMLTNNCPRMKPEKKEKIKLITQEYLCSSIGKKYKYFADLAKKSTLVSSFSEINDSILMWSHYADYHRGFCLGYDFKSPQCPDGIRTRLYPIIYQENLIDITDYLMSVDDEFNNIFLTIASIIKSIEWEYEKEWRIVVPPGTFGKEMAIRVPLPKAIYAGSKIDAKNKEKLKNYSSENDIQFFQAILDRNKFGIKFEKE